MDKGTTSAGKTLSVNQAGSAKGNIETKPLSVQQTNRPQSSTNGRTTIQVQSLKSNSPRLKETEVNGANNDEINRLSFGEKKDIVSTALPLSRSASNLENLNRESAKSISDTKPAVNGRVSFEAPVRSTNETIKPVESVPKPGPMSEQRSKNISVSADNVSKPDVVKSSINSAKPSAKVVINADKQMIDLDSFTDRKNMLSELKKFDKQLKPVQHASNVTEVKLSLGKEFDNKNSGINGKEVDTNGDKANSKNALLSEIKLAKKPSETKEVNPVKQDKQKQNIPKSTGSENQVDLFNDLLKAVDSGTDSSESANSSPREYEQKTKVEVKALKDGGKAVGEPKNTVVPEVAQVSEISFSKPRNVTTIEEESEDNDETEEDDDRFVSEFQFPGKPANTKISPDGKSVTQKKGKFHLHFI